MKSKPGTLPEPNTVILLRWLIYIQVLSDTAWVISISESILKKVGGEKAKSSVGTHQLTNI